jgi:hypothetical protein
MALKIAVSAILLVVGVIAPTYAADTFTFTATGRDAGSAWIKLDGQNIGATASTVISVGVGPNGTSQTSNGRCQSWTPEPDGGYALETVCNYTTSDGTYATISWCPKDMAKGCSGKLVGVSGAYTNRKGTFIVLTKPGSDSETDSYSGSGEWD